MTTVSFDKKTTDILIEGLSKENETIPNDKNSITAEINNGKVLIKRVCKIKCVFF